MLILFYLVMLIVFVIDQLSKYWIRANLAVRESIEVWEGVLHFTHIKNSGTAFGLFAGYGRLFVPVAILVVCFFIYLLRKKILEGKLAKIGAGLYAGGALGNALDRVLFNEVTDFIHFQFNNGIPNLADYALTLGIFLLVIDQLIIDPIKKQRTARRLKEIEPSEN